MQPPNDERQPYYPPPGQQYYPPGPAPRKRRRRWPIFLLVGALLLCVIVAVAVATSSPTAKSPTTATTATSGSAATTVPTKAGTSASQPKWTTVQTINGNGSKKTGTFSAPDDWKIVWTCAEQNIGGVTADGALAVSVYGSDNTIIDPAAVNATCKVGQAKTTGETEEHQGGNVYLDINGTGDWTVKIQELK